MNDISGLPRASVTWHSKLTSTQRPLWSHGGTEHLKILTWFWDISNPHWFVPYIFWWNKKNHIYTLLYAIVCWQQADINCGTSGLRPSNSCKAKRLTSYDEFMTNVTGLTGSVGLTGCGRTNRTRSALWDLHHRQSQPHRMRWPHIIKQTSQDETSLTGLGGPKRMRSASQDKAGLTEKGQPHGMRPA